MKPVYRVPSTDLIQAGLYKDATPREVMALTSSGIDLDSDIKPIVRLRILYARQYFTSIGKYKKEK